MFNVPVLNAEIVVNNCQRQRKSHSLSLRPNFGYLIDGRVSRHIGCWNFFTCVAETLQIFQSIYLFLCSTIIWFETASKHFN